MLSIKTKTTIENEAVLTYKEENYWIARKTE